MARTRGPQVDEEGLALFRQKDLKLEALKSCFQQFEEQRLAKETPTTQIAFEALTSLLGARAEGYTDEQLQSCLPEAWGTSTVALPTNIVLCLAEAWLKYKKGVKGRTMGEAFGLEGGGQGKQRAIDRQSRAQRSRSYANLVVLYHANGVSLETALELTAQELDVTLETVKAAYKTYGREARKKAEEAGIFKRG